MVNYILDAEHHVVAEPDLLTWAAFMEEHERRIVEQTFTKLYWVSTVFIGVDYRWTGKGPPVVFETMTFDRKHVVKENALAPGRLWRVREEADLDFGFDRYGDWDEALTGHRCIVRKLLRMEAKAEAKTP